MKKYRVSKYSKKKKKIFNLTNSKKNYIISNSTNKIIDEIESYITYFDEFLTWYNNEELKKEDENNNSENNNSEKIVEIDDELFEELIRCFYRINILYPNYPLEEIISKENIYQVVNEYKYKLIRLQELNEYKIIYLNKRYSLLKDYIMQNCTRIISSKFKIGKFRKKDIILLQQFDSDNHGNKYPVMLLKIKNVKIVFKPRKALIDQKVMELFININITLKKYKSKYKLPTYIILNCGNYSFWEYIDGDTLYEKGKNNLRDEKLNKNIINNLEFLNTIAHKIGLTDLHSQNVKIQKDYMIPIDLEVIKPGSNTGLYMENKEAILGPIVPIHPIIQYLINVFNENSVNIPIRILPIDTSTLKDFLKDDNSISINTLINTFKKNIPEWESKHMTTEKLHSYFVYCKKHNIVPYFFTQFGKIFIKKIEK